MAKIPLDEMSLNEKLDAMEAIWDDLCQRAEEVPSPEWHGEVLAQRKSALERGETIAEDWEVAKARLLRESE